MGILALHGQEPEFMFPLHVSLPGFWRGLDLEQGDHDLFPRALLAAQAGYLTRLWPGYPSHEEDAGCVCKNPPEIPHLKWSKADESGIQSSS